jgi:pentatricopeptide repeat protein
MDCYICLCSNSLLINKDGIQPDVVTWTAIIGAFVQHDDGRFAMDCFQKMQEEGITPNAHTYSTILKACGIMGASEDGMILHDWLVRVGLHNPVIENALIDMYMRCGNARESHRLISRLRFRNVVSWGALIEGYSRSGNVDLALQCFYEMQDDGIEPNEAIFVCVLTACSHSGLVDEGFKLFNLMKDEHNITPTLHHRICMVDLLARAGYLRESEKVLSTLGIDLNGCRALLTAGRTFGSFDVGKRYFEQCIEHYS